MTVSISHMTLRVTDHEQALEFYRDKLAQDVEFVSPPKEQPFGIEAVMRDGVGNWFSLTQHVTADISGRSK